MKAHVGTDPQGLVHTVDTTSARVHDVDMMGKCLHGEEEVIYGDTAYVSKARKENAEAHSATWRVLRKATRSRKLNCAYQSFNRKSNRTRARVEHVFGVIKHQWGYRKVRYRGLEKNTVQLYALFALANFQRAGDRLLALQQGSVCRVGTDRVSRTLNPCIITEFLVQNRVARCFQPHFRSNVHRWAHFAPRRAFE